jgi:hypothetical protein
MAKHNDLGKAGENAAVAYLEQKEIQENLHVLDWQDG